MNCRICNTPAAPHEMVDKGEDLKGVCLSCLVKQRNTLADALCKMLESVDASGDILNDLYSKTDIGQWREMIERNQTQP